MRRYNFEQPLRTVHFNKEKDDISSRIQFFKDMKLCWQSDIRGRRRRNGRVVGPGKVLPMHLRAVRVQRISAIHPTKTIDICLLSDGQGRCEQFLRIMLSRIQNLGDEVVQGSTLR